MCPGASLDLPWRPPASHVRQWRSRGPKNFAFRTNRSRNRVFLDVSLAFVLLFSVSSYVGRISWTALKNHRHVRPPCRVPNFIVGFIYATRRSGRAAGLLATFRAFFARRLFPPVFIILPILFLRRTHLSSSWLLVRRPYVRAPVLLVGMRARAWCLPRHDTQGRETLRESF